VKTKKHESAKKEKEKACKERMIKKTSCSKTLKWLCEMGYGERGEAACALLLRAI
jgi:hypothetical protein